MKPFIQPCYQRPERLGRVSHHLAAWRPTVNDQMERTLRDMDVIDRSARAKRMVGMGACLGANVAGLGMLTFGSIGTGLATEILVGNGHLDDTCGMFAPFQTWGATGFLTAFCIGRAGTARQHERGLVEAAWAGLGIGLFLVTECIRIVHNTCYLAVEAFGALAGAGVGVVLAGSALCLDEWQRFFGVPGLAL